MRAPCKDCPDRKLGCHSVCEKYIAFDKHRKELLAKQAAEVQLKNDIYWSHRNRRERKWW